MWWRGAAYSKLPNLEQQLIEIVGGDDRPPPSVIRKIMTQEGGAGYQRRKMGYIKPPFSSPDEHHRLHTSLLRKPNPPRSNTKASDPRSSQKSTNPPWRLYSLSSSLSLPSSPLFHRVMAMIVRATSAVLATLSAKCDVAVLDLLPVITVAGYIGIVAREHSVMNFLHPDRCSVDGPLVNPRLLNAENLELRPMEGGFGFNHGRFIYLFISLFAGKFKVYQNLITPWWSSAIEGICSLQSWWPG